MIFKQPNVIYLEYSGKIIVKAVANDLLYRLVMNGIRKNTEATEYAETAMILGKLTHPGIQGGLITRCVK